MQNILEKTTANTRQRKEITYLKVKIVSLMLEARYIRKCEQQAKSHRNTDLYLGLNSHRRVDVRSEARLTQIVYGFLRGRKYRQIEQHTERELNILQVHRMKKMVDKYGTRNDAARFEAWLTASADSDSSPE